MEVIPGTGTKDIRFGITKAETVEQLGKPDKTYITDEGCERLQFNSLRVELSFEPENDSRLGWLEIHNSAAAIGGRNIIGMSQDEALSYLNEVLDEQPEIEDYGSFLSVSYEAHWVELQVQFGIVDCINVGVLYDESENPSWPSS